MMNRNFGYYTGGSGGYMSGGGILLCALMALLIIALTVLTVVIIVRLLRRRSAHDLMGRVPHPPFTRTGALDILNERFAKGEINADEYQRIKTEITRS